jgi:hypothetical protein
MNIPATFGPICFCGSLEEDWNVYGRTTDAKWSGELKINKHVSFKTFGQNKP